MFGTWNKQLFSPKQHQTTGLRVGHLWCFRGRQTPNFCVLAHLHRTGVLYRAADRFLARCILFVGENISFDASLVIYVCTRVGTLIVATIYLQLIQNRYMFRSFTVLQCSHQHCLQPIASDVEVVGYI